jgi:hypothetical protein
MRLALVITMLGVTVAHAEDARPPAGATRITIDYTYASFHSNELHYKIEWNKTGYRASNKKSIDGKLVEALYASLTDLREFDDDIRCLSHTDDYPRFTIAIEGDSPVILKTESNCHANVPWNVIRNGKHYAQFNADIPKAVYKLLAALDPGHWNGRADRPDSFTAFGGEIVDLGVFSPDFKQASPAAMACVKDLETSPRVKKLFGETLTVSELGLVCSLSPGADCRDTIAQAKFLWDGVETQVELPCTKGVIEIPAPAAAQLKELRAFLDSKVARTLVRMAGDHPPRVWSNGDWMMEAMIDDGPMITFTPGTKTIHIRGVGDKGPGAVAFLKELGIDAKRVTRKQGDDFFETEANVDFNGHLVK